MAPVWDLLQLIWMVDASVSLTPAELYWFSRNDRIGDLGHFVGHSDRSQRIRSDGGQPVVESASDSVLGRTSFGHRS